MNVLAIIEIIFDKFTVRDALEEADAPAPTTKKPKTARKDRHSAPVGGAYGAAEVGAAGLDPTSTAGLSIAGLTNIWKSLGVQWSGSDCKVMWDEMK